MLAPPGHCHRLEMAPAAPAHTGAGHSLTGRVAQGKCLCRDPVQTPGDEPAQLQGSCREVSRRNSLLDVHKSIAAGPPVLAASKCWCCQPPALVFNPGNRSEVLDRPANYSSLQRQVGLCHMMKDILLAWNVAALLWHFIKKKKERKRCELIGLVKKPSSALVFP